MILYKQRHGSVQYDHMLDCEALWDEKHNITCYNLILWIPVFLQLWIYFIPQYSILKLALRLKKFFLKTFHFMLLAKSDDWTINKIIPWQQRGIQIKKVENFLSYKKAGHQPYRRSFIDDISRIICLTCAVLVYVTLRILWHKIS